MASVGVVIPALNETNTLPGLLRDLSDVMLPLEITVVDGGSLDDTVSLARSCGAKVISAPRGRAVQMNAGAEACETDWLCFLHADVRVPPAARRDLERVVDDPAVHAAVWRLAIDDDGLWFRLVERGAWLRDRLGGFAYGDQGLMVRREPFERLGGFPIIPVFEDVALVNALRREVKVLRLASPLLVSARRWTSEGPYRTWVRNGALLAGYVIGVSPERLARWYRPHRA